MHEMPAIFTIHPSIGICRLGTSQEYFFGPQPSSERNARLEFERTQAPWGYRDSRGRLRRQAAVFRVFEMEVDKQGKAVSAPKEVTPDRARIEWTIHVANRKAAGKQFGSVREDKGRRNAWA